jgi:hydrogenase maturation factor
MQSGKIPNDILDKEILRQLQYTRPEVKVYPDIGEDCSVVEFEQDMQIVLSTDPITGASNQIGKLAVHVSCNDISSAGAEPVGILVTLLLPLGTTKEEIRELMKDIHDTATKLQIVVLGGHSEITEAVNSPIVSTTVIGKVKKGKLVQTKGATIGDDVILTKWAGLEGTAILANDLEQDLSKHLSGSILQEAKSLMNHISVLKESKIAQEVVVTSMHDVTEGGVLGAAHELAECAKVGIEIDLDKIPILACTQEICNYFDISPYRLISSGCMLLTTPMGKQALEWFSKNNIQAAVIGKIIPEGKHIKTGNDLQILEGPESDELYKALQKKQ